MILHIETSGKTCSVALANEGVLLGGVENTPDKFQHAEVLNVYIEQLMNEANLSLKELTAVCVSSGPGSYTGLRIGVSTAKGLCYALSIPLISVATLKGMFTQFLVSYSGNATSFIPMIDARRMEVYTTTFDVLGNVTSELQALVVDDTTFATLSEPTVLFGDGADKLQELPLSKNGSISQGFKSTAKGLVKDAYAKFQAKDFEDVAYFTPNYLKEFKAG